MQRCPPMPVSKALLASWMAFLKASGSVAPEPTWKDTPLTAMPNSLAACSATRTHQHHRMPRCVPQVMGWRRLDSQWAYTCECKTFQGCRYPKHCEAMDASASIPCNERPTL